VGHEIIGSALGAPTKSLANRSSDRSGELLERRPHHLSFRYRLTACGLLQSHRLKTPKQRIGHFGAKFRQQLAQRLKLATDPPAAHRPTTLWCRGRLNLLLLFIEVVPSEQDRL